MKKNFLIGVATSSHQNEGNNYLNNWWHWEIKKNLERSGKACNSWEDYKEEMNCAKNIGCNSFRFSLEWSRICITEDKISIPSIKRYEDMIDYCFELNMEPIVTLHHFTRPRWFDMKYGGLHNRILLKYFKKYVKIVMKHFGKKVRYWITYNEPMLECVNGYIRGTRPPGKKVNFELMYLALINILDSHCIAYKVIKKYNPEAKVSIAKNLVDFEKQYYYDLVKSNIEEQIINNFNWGLLDALYKGEFNFGINIAGIGVMKTKRRNEWKNKLDFLGINHYNVGYVDISYSIKNPIDVLLTLNKGIYSINALNWDIKPNSLNNVIESIVNKYGEIDILISESGSCEHKDSLENNNLHKTVMNTHMITAIENKHVFGYLWWSLIDNFEWDDGWKPKFGLYRLVKKNNKYHREIKDSGLFFKNIISNYYK